jgi:uncharacterized protein (TIGR03435 family)
MDVVSRALALLVIATLGAPLSAQQASFELTSVKRNDSGSGRSNTGAQANGGWRGMNVRLREVIARAYEVREFQLEGGPDWINGDRFDIVGRGPEGTPNDQRAPMLRGLLADRFKLVAHVETRERPVYALVLAREDGRLGPQLKRSPLPCAPPGVPGVAGQSVSCGANTSVSGGGGTISVTGMAMDNIAATLANYALDRVVINRTGLDGAFDFELRFASPQPGGAPRADDPPSIFTAVQDQLGLKLENARGPVPFVIIDSVQPPTPD